ncbi:MAG: pyridoxal 5'-phosphate synthase glutaminase subunit PdxT [Candidatus Fermentibacter sp.]|nr:pyridoxal 5'-phosphate synthase glutaminase subunit PdxT [Candidatus Fermentibacter sp.]
MGPVGVLALQGGVREHIEMLRRIGADVREVRLPGDLRGLSRLVLPGGESTALIRLLDIWGMIGPLKDLVGDGVPVWGTCAGAVLLSAEVAERDHEVDQPSLGLARVRAVRNAFGRQVHSFQQDLDIAGLGRPFPGVFIRAPLLEPLSSGVEVLCSLKEGPVLLRDGRVWLSSFHPELTADDAVHRLFLESRDE